jgi:ABC-type uncharacterized transport system YnjBCD substrate-binding protein
MAKVRNNIFVRGLSGAIGDQFVIRTTRSGKTIIANKPRFDDQREFTEKQKTHQDAFREATTYAKFAKTQPLYIEMAKRSGSTAYNIAISDWFGAPQVLEINVDNWTGEMGQTIRVKARDNVKVARVAVVIRDANEKILEMGAAVQSEEGTVWWTYTTQALVPMTPFPTVEAIAQDLPGNTDSFIIN